jgi:8-oxo-dGTP diphosphatase
VAEKPRRATLIIIRNDRVLLARDESLDFWSLPGGRIEAGESDEAAAARELNEETGLELRSLEYLLEHESDVRCHRVFRITVNDAEPAPGNEIAELKWWDGHEPIKRASSVTGVLSHPAIGFLPARG